MDEFKTFALKWYLEGIILSRIEKAILDVKEIPAVMHRVIVIQTAEDFCQEAKENYAFLKKEFAKENVTIVFTVQEFNQIIDDVVSQLIDLLCD